jgi:hypothetical protein
MFVQPRILSIFTTRRCTAQCDHCCVGAGPRASGSITVARIHALIEEAKRVPSIQRIVFTGGEAFLLGRALDALVSHAHGAGFDTRIISNAYWAVNERAAESRVASLRAAGLDEIVLSTGAFHEAFVPRDRVVHAARATTRAGIATRIAIEDCDQSQAGDEPFRAQLEEPLRTGLLAISRDPWIADAGQRGTAVLSHDARRAAGRVRYGGGCANVLTTISVTPDQQLVACCGFPLEELPGLRIGSVAERALPDVLHDAPDDLLKIFLHVLGPAGIADFVARYEPGYTLPRDPVSICDACIAFQRDTRAMRVAAEHAGEVAAEIVARFAASQAALVVPRAAPARLSS